jgi:hypothetical protein
MLLGMPVSAGFVDKASARLDARLQDAGFDGAMQAALAAEPALGADETPVNVIAPHADPGTGEPEGSPHVLIIRPPSGKLTWLRALGSRRAAAITAILGFFTGFLITDGYTAYQQMLPKLAGIQQCAAHVIRRCRAVAGLGPGSLQSWAADVIEILRDAHRLTEQARARGEPCAGAEPLGKLRERYDKAIAFGITHNRHRDWHDGNHPRLHARLLAARLRRPGLAVHHRARRRLDERSGVTLHLLGAFCSVGVFAVVRSCCRCCAEYCVWH